MTKSISASCLRPLNPKHHFRLGIKVDASRGQNVPDTENAGRYRATRKFQNARDEELRQGRDVYQRQRANRREQLEEKSAHNLEYLKSLDRKESILEVQTILPGKLAAEENHLKGLAINPELSVTEFDRRVREVEESIHALHY